MMQREQKTYYHAVERSLTCSRRQKQMLMGKLRGSVEDCIPRRI